MITRYVGYYIICAPTLRKTSVRIQTKLEDTKTLIPKLQTEENNLTDEIDRTLSDYRDTEELSQALNQDRLKAHRRLLRFPLETGAHQELNPKDAEFEAQRFNRSVDTVSEWIGEPPPHYLTERERMWEEEKREKEETEARRRQQQEERDHKLAERKKKAAVKSNRSQNVH